ncbi:hypothetical protein EUGRSUZ_L01311 [Eucalyptus grandis]|uniref:Enoyl reductase (ER) domain-containing protein n=2 Tax=Eucalyptus grandis TaxID=71139 RepID=A0A058ZVL7_EUCGR|nr:hypothetical protein EUGRSUZ_L01311 [Eucalyptus grandis]
MAMSPENEHPVKAFGWAARDTTGHLSPFKFSRSSTEGNIFSSIYIDFPFHMAIGENDVTFKVLYCGICPSDLHSMVTEIGTKVTKFKVGDKVGVGCMVGSCRSCPNCKDDLENYCPKILSYGAKYNDGTTDWGVTTTTYGGYSDIMVSDKHFVIKIPDNLPLDGGAPLLCAGITVYNPLKYYGLNKAGMHLGIVGLGGLGHVAIMFPKAVGLKVTVISTSPNKKKVAMDHLGVNAFMLAMGTMDGIIDTVSAVHALLPFINLLKNNGKLVMVGAPEKLLELLAFPLLMEMIDFATKKNVVADIELIHMDYVNTAMEHLSKADIKY